MGYSDRFLVVEHPEGAPAQCSPSTPERLAAGVVPLTAAYLDQVRRIERESFANPWAEDEFRRVLADEDMLCLGLREDQELIGYAVGHADGPELHLASLAIAAPHRRRGWGGLLLRQVLAEARRRGCARCRLEVRASNRAATRLYRSAGFAQVDRWPAHYVRPREDALVMQRSLEETDEKQSSSRPRGGGRAGDAAWPGGD